MEPKKVAKLLAAAEKPPEILLVNKIEIPKECMQRIKYSLVKYGFVTLELVKEHKVRIVQARRVKIISKRGRKRSMKRLIAG